MPLYEDISIGEGLRAEHVADPSLPDSSRQSNVGTGNICFDYNQTVDPPAENAFHRAFWVLDESDVEVRLNQATEIETASTDLAEATGFFDFPNLQTVAADHYAELDYSGPVFTMLVVLPIADVDANLWVRFRPTSGATRRTQTGPRR